MVTLKCIFCEKIFKLHYDQTLPALNKKKEKGHIVFCPYCGKKYIITGMPKGAE